MSLELGEVYVYGQDSATAKAIMRACGRLGIDRTTVRTTEGGFAMPEAVWDEVEKERRPDWVAAEGAVF